MTLIQWSLGDCKSGQLLARRCPRPKPQARVIPRRRLGGQKGGAALRSLVAHLAFQIRCPSTLGCAFPQREGGHSWWDIRQCCHPSSDFPVGIKAAGILSLTPQESQIHCFFFFFSFFFRGSLLGVEGREESLQRM